MYDYSRLRRFPDVEAPNLQAWDATDELLVDWAGAAGIAGDCIAVIGDEYGAITLALTDAGLRGIRVHQDLVTGRRALASNARALGSDPDAFTSHELDETLLRGAQLVLVQLPKSLAALDEIADAVARWAAPEVVLVAGGRVKHMTLTQNDVLARYFTSVHPQRATRKSRLLVAASPPSPPAEKPLPVPETTTHVVSHTADGFSPVEFTLCAYGGAFAGSKLDIGTRALLDAMPALSAGYRVQGSAVERSQLRKNEAAEGQNASNGGSSEQISGVTNEGMRVIDLGCGTGALAVAFALQHPTATIVATDRSAAAVRSARATVSANGLDDRITVTLDDAGSDLPDGGADLVLLNPPFHLGASVHEGAGRRLIEAAARLVRPGGEVWTVFNSHLDHRRALTRVVGPTEQVSRTPKFTVTRSTRHA
ncbi:methyltransferase [Microbacterium esteraromaticum]|uniref:class I SAM-dependent methyltransferase n=1 Tax=Microbacterium esteraromaticum TaxID=57043 RepID=UPI001CD3B24A|nr:methyltransferase [Microbacterium esteraromaticum]MCA1307306.1 methyltransferase [Microbacterium esteraromaticum]